MAYQVCSPVEPVFKVLNRSALHSGSTSDPSFLNPEHFLEVARSMRTWQAQEAECSLPAAPDTNILLRFTDNLFSSFHSSREANAQNLHPGFLELLSVLENAYDRKFTEGLAGVIPLVTLWICTANIIMWSQVI